MLDYTSCYAYNNSIIILIWNNLEYYLTSLNPEFFAERFELNEYYHKFENRLSY